MVKKLDFLPDKHHYAITAVTCASAQLDHLIEHVIAAALFTHNNTAKFLLKNLAGDRLISLLEALIIDSLPAEKDNVQAAVAEINRLRTDRNEITHWLWEESNESPDSAVHMTFRPYREGTKKTKTADQIQSIADGMNALAEPLIRWADTIDPPHDQQLPQTP